MTSCCPNSINLFALLSGKILSWEDSSIFSSCLSTSICLKIIDPWFLQLSTDSKKEILKSFFSLLEEKEAAYDINHYPSAPPGIRIWGGGTVESSNIELLLPWLDWAWEYIEK